ncbi:MAG: choice-of-anchor Q domain-containing protein [Verrucomicrobiota bacterium]
MNLIPTFPIFPTDLVTKLSPLACTRGIAICLLTLSWGLPLQAATFNVTSLADSGTGSLREAITSAEANAEADEINFQISGTINIGSTLPTITTEIAINGSGQAVILDGVNNGMRAFFINSGAVVTISDLTIQNFDEVDNVGGVAVIISGGSLSFDSVSLLDNTSSDAGGVIFMQSNGSFLSIQNSTVDGNSGPLGGVIFAQNAVTIDIDGSDFDGNSAFQGGVIVAINGPDLFIDDCTFTSNRALFLEGDNSGTSGEGAVMFLRNSGTVTHISHSTFSNNQSDDESGVLQGSLSAPITIEDCILDSNTSGDDGGAIHLLTGADLTIRRSDITNNTSTGATGGGINLANAGTTLLLEECLVDNNNSGSIGGGINSQEGDVTVVRSTISRNTANLNGGGLSTSGGGSLRVENSTITDNSASGGGGGGMSVASGTSAEVDSSTIAFNDASGSGGGISFSPDSTTFNLTNSILSNNTSTADVSTNNISGAVDSGGHNLFDDAGGGLVAAMTGDQFNAVADLQALADNGGPTQTHALGSSSDAIDAGSTSLVFDQRKFTRTAGTASDIGAFESNSISVTSFAFWAENSGLTAGVNDGLTDDPNTDGIFNLVHFADDTDPLGTESTEGKQTGSVTTIDNDEFLTFTRPVRLDAEFIATTSGGLDQDTSTTLTAIVDGILYSIIGSDDLANPTDLEVVEAESVLDDGLPALRDLDGDGNADWEYRTFRLSSPISAQDRGFLNAIVSGAF